MWFFGANDTSYHWTLANSWGKKEENLNQVRHIMFVMALPLHLEFLLSIRYSNHYWLHAAHIWESSRSFWWRSSCRSAANATRLMLFKHATNMTNVAAGLFSRTFWVRSDFLRVLLVIFNNYSSRPHGLRGKSPWGRRSNGLLTQRPWGREE